MVVVGKEEKGDHQCGIRMELIRVNRGTAI